MTFYVISRLNLKNGYEAQGWYPLVLDSMHAIVKDIFNMQ